MIRALLVALCLVFGPAAFAQARPDSTFQWDTNQSAVRVTLTLDEAGRLDRQELGRALVVSVEPRDVLAAIHLPPLVGEYALEGRELEFRPKFPFEPGMAYRATLQIPGMPARSSTLRLERPVLDRTTVVRAIYPSAEVLPQNLLKFYLHFSAPMSGGHIYEHISLTDEQGELVELPFLEIDEELWNPEMTRLTLFLDPGRIKREVKPLEEVGPALEPGKRYVLRIDARWLDARGAPLAKPFEKRFAVVEPDRAPPDPRKWAISSPAEGSLEAVQIDFGKAMDRALALRMLAIKDANGKWMEGSRSLDGAERVWKFVPATPWKKGRYSIYVPSTIEDLAGNNIGEPFEVDLAEGQARPAAKTVRLAFEVK